MKLILSPRDAAQKLELNDVEAFFTEGPTLGVVFSDGRRRNYPLVHLWWFGTDAPIAENRTKPVVPLAQIHEMVDSKLASGTEDRTVINSYTPFGDLVFTQVTADEMESLIRNDEWTSGPYYGSPWVFGTLKMGTRVGYDRRLGTNYANAAVADAWASKTHLVQRMTDHYCRQDQADRPKS